MAADGVQKTALRGPPLAVPLRAVKTLAARLSILFLLAAPAVLAAPKRALRETVRSGSEAANGSKTHLVAPGQTIGKIAKRYHVSVEQLRETNELRPGVTLKPGTRLTIPADDVPTDRSAKKPTPDATDERTDTPKSKAGQDRNDRDAEGDLDDPDDGKSKGKKGHAKADNPDDKRSAKGARGRPYDQDDKRSAKGKADEADEPRKGSKGRVDPQDDKKTGRGKADDQDDSRAAHRKTTDKASAKAHGKPAAEPPKERKAQTKTRAQKKKPAT